MATCHQICFRKFVARTSTPLNLVLGVMNIHDPDLSVNAEEWLEMDEAVRLDLIVKHHQKSSESEPEGGWELHSTLHCVVENQIALATENVRETLAKLIRQGLSRHDAIHAIGTVVSEDLFEMSKDKKVWDSTQ